METVIIVIHLMVVIALVASCFCSARKAAGSA